MARAQAPVENEEVENEVIEPDEDLEDEDESDEDESDESDEDESDEDEDEDEPDLTEFDAAVEVAVAAADQSTGVVPGAELNALRVAYGALGGAKPKTAARNSIQNSMRAAVDEKDILKAQVFLFLGDNIVKSAPKERKTRKPANPTESFIEHKLVVAAAYSNLQVPDGLDDDHEERFNSKWGEFNADVKTYLDWIGGDKGSRGDEPEVSAMVKQAAKLAAGRKVRATGGGGGGGAVRTYSGPSRSVSKHIAQVFDAQAPGTFLKVSEVASATSAEYGDDHPSSGAITAALRSAKFAERHPALTPVLDEKPHGIIKK